MTGRVISIPKGFTLNKHGKLVRTSAHKDVSARIRERTSKKLRVVRKGK